jgi:hypothetical protein
MHRRLAQNPQVREAQNCGLTDCMKLFKNCRSLERRALHDSNLYNFSVLYCPVEYGGYHYSKAISIGVFPGARSKTAGTARCPGVGSQIPTIWVWMGMEEPTQ